MTTNGLQTDHSEKLSIFPHTKLSLQNLLSPSNVLVIFFHAAGRSQVKKKNLFFYSENAF